jgi:hypothetical protein
MRRAWKAQVGAGRNLAVGVLGRQPDFQIVGLGGGETHVAGAQHDAAIGQFQRFENGFGVAGQLFVRSGGWSGWTICTNSTLSN